jgi:hypothetical protein
VVFREKKRASADLGEALLRCCYDSSTNLVSPYAECPHPRLGKRERIAENSAVGGGADHVWKLLVIEPGSREI